MQSRGHSAFSREAVEFFSSLHHKGGLSGSKIDSIEEIDEMVRSSELDRQWKEDAIKMAARRRKDYESESNS